MTSAILCGERGTAATSHQSFFDGFSTKSFVYLYHKKRKTQLLTFPQQHSLKELNLKARPFLYFDPTLSYSLSR